MLNRSKCDRGWFPLDDAHVPIEKEKKLSLIYRIMVRNLKHTTAYACLIDDQLLHY